MSVSGTNDQVSEAVRNVGYIANSPNPNLSGKLPADLKGFQKQNYTKYTLLHKKNKSKHFQNIVSFAYVITKQKSSSKALTCFRLCNISFAGKGQVQKKDRQSTEEVLAGRRKDGSKVINKHKKCINRKKRRSRHAQSGTFTVSNLNPTSSHRPFKSTYTVDL